MGENVCPGAGRRRSHPGQHRAQCLRLWPVHRRNRHSSGCGGTRRHGRPGVGRDDAAPGHAHRRSAPGHPDLHAVLRGPARRGARRGWTGAPRRAGPGRGPGAGRGRPAGLCGAEPWTESLRSRIEELLGLRALDIYGLSEVIGTGVAAECVVAADGMHVNEDHFLVEAVDLVTGAGVPDGTAGELVFTTVTKEALPLLRYRTGDIAALQRRRCPCGRTLIKMSRITGRRDDMLVIRGVNVYPSALERVLLAEEALAPDYLLVVDERAADRRLVACCEYRTDYRGRLPAADELESRLREVLGLSVRVTVLPAGTVPRSEIGKAVRVVRWAEGEPPVPGLGG